jgi:hypothetical protein
MWETVGLLSFGFRVRRRNHPDGWMNEIFYLFYVYKKTIKLMVDVEGEGP